MQSTTMYTTPSIFVANPPHPRFLEEEGERGGISTAEPSWGSIVASRHCSISRCSIRIFILDASKVKSKGVRIVDVVLMSIQILKSFSAPHLWRYHILQILKSKGV
jgi:hypothetical protein